MHKLTYDDPQGLISRFIVNETSSFRSSIQWVHDYEKILKRGFNGIKKEAQEKIAALDPMDSAQHEAQTGLPNTRILDNFRILAEEFPDLPVLARTPVIPGFNDTEEAIAAIATFLKPYERVEYEMLPYHRLGTQKYHFLDRPVPMPRIKATTDAARKRGFR